jgi:hypothetical protein
MNGMPKDGITSLKNQISNAASFCTRTTNHHTDRASQVRKTIAKQMPR